ncbi:bifunctional serine/threonine-protein kinase/formylglycine-generating enzyme family protein [Fimbriiglobus ruber]|uniref:Serine/threonine kinase n=1 Tax=Fimbriiglobus ruber TaxID=1908690 RepID=A0A225E4S0_9BACT|nr:bifunctional serine/threonine-protein kinase/formylglycine-generating enzyme family protein [Fimbriiglobus ruber]OWK43407.1 serine/threonine kinase [Fimbriiglobus ruber]
MIEFFSAVAAGLAVAAPVAQNLGQIAQGGRRIWGLAADILDRFRARVPADQQQAVLKQALTQAATMPAAEFEKKAEEIVELVLADKPVEERKRIAETIKLMPDRIRATFARQDDPSGTTAPPQWAATRPEDIIPLLPPRPPLFRRGDPVPDNNRWTLVDRLGIGGFGEVWKARNREDDFSVIKFCLDPGSQERMFTHERKIIKLVRAELDDHPNIVKLMDSHLEGPTPWLQYEFAPGGDLLHNFATWPKDLAARATMAVEKVLILAETMAHCHALRPMAVIHRDLKPANVVIGKKGVYKITDFGIGDTTARQALEEARIATISGHTASTTSIRYFNTPMYASPDQKKGLDPHPADDVHALGVMLYQFILGNVGLELGIDMWNDLESLHVCPQLLVVLDKAVATRVERRYQHAGELAEALRTLPKKLIAEPNKPAPVGGEYPEKLLYSEIDRYWKDAKSKNETARQQLDRGEWKAAIATLEAIFHPVMRDGELYARAVQYRDGKNFVNSLGIEFAFVPKGVFWVGGEKGKCGSKQVTISQDFYIGVYPVTQEEWQKVMGNNPSYFQKGGFWKGGKGSSKLTGMSNADLNLLPVESVSWNNCNIFIQKLNERLKESGWLYRLPRESEWEYACRGGAATQALCAWNYYFRSPANKLSPQKANVSELGLGRTTKVGTYEPNGLGIYDMHGNVWEWCEDAYDGSSRVIRGGSWHNSAVNARAAFRQGYAPTSAYNFLGLRLVRVPSGSR